MVRATKHVLESKAAVIVESGAIHTAYIIEDNGRLFHIVLSAGNHDYRLEKKRGGHRTFKTLDAAAQLIRSWGISKIRLHMNEPRPGHEPFLY